MRLGRDELVSVFSDDKTVPPVQPWRKREAALFALVLALFLLLIRHRLELIAIWTNRDIVDFVYFVTYTSMMCFILLVAPVLVRNFFAKRAPSFFWLKWSSAKRWSHLETVFFYTIAWVVIGVPVLFFNQINGFELYTVVRAAIIMGLLAGLIVGVLRNLVFRGYF